MLLILALIIKKIRKANLLYRMVGHSWNSILKLNIINIFMYFYWFCSNGFVPLNINKIETAFLKVGTCQTILILFSSPPLTLVKVVKSIVLIKVCSQYREDNMLCYSYGHCAAWGLCKNMGTAWLVARWPLALSIYIDTHRFYYPPTSVIIYCNDHAAGRLLRLTS